jgi:hypothetical protein
LGTTGVINGTPTTAGSSTFTVQVTDSSTPAQTATKALTLGVLAIAPSTLPNPTQGVSYSQTLSVTGGAPSYSWTAPQTGLPPGINFVAALPGFTGTPTAAGTYTFTVGVTDSTGGSATQQYSATVQAPLTMTTASLPGGTQQAPYSQVVAASGGQAPYTWSIAASSWVGPYPPYQLTPTKPQWSINNSGTLTATPTLFGTYLVTVQVTDSLASTATRQFSINVQPASTTDLAPLKGFEYFPRGHAWWSVFYDWYTNDCDTNTAHIYAQGDCLAGTVSDAVQADLQTLHNAGFNYVHLYLWDRDIVQGQLGTTATNVPGWVGWDEGCPQISPSYGQSPTPYNGPCDQYTLPSGTQNQWTALEDFISRAAALNIKVALDFDAAWPANEIGTSTDLTLAGSVGGKYAAWLGLFAREFAKYQNVVIWGFSYDFAIPNVGPASTWSTFWSSAYPDFLQVLGQTPYPGVGRAQTVYRTGPPFGLSPYAGLGGLASVGAFGPMQEPRSLWLRRPASPGFTHRRAVCSRLFGFHDAGQQLQLGLLQRLRLRLARRRFANANSGRLLSCLGGHVGDGSDPNALRSLCSSTECGY